MRCISTPYPTCTRCPRAASSRDGLYMCVEHWVPPRWVNCFNEERTRRMLAHAQWETIAEGQKLIDDYVGQTREVA